MSVEATLAIVVSAVSLIAAVLTAGRLAFRTEAKVEHLEEKSTKMESRIDALDGVAAEGKAEHFRLVERVDGIKEALSSIHNDMNNRFDRLERKLDKEDR